MQNKKFRKIENKDEKTFFELVERYKNRLFRFIYSIIFHYQDSEDILQEVFLKAYKSGDNLVFEEGVDKWLFKVAYNACIDYKRKKKSFSLNKEYYAYEFESNPVKNNIFSDNEIKKKIYNSIKELPENQRVSIILKIFEDKSYKEIADIIGCSVSSVESLIFRARQNLRNKLKDLL